MSEIVILKKALLVMELNEKLSRYIEISDMKDSIILINRKKPLQNVLVKHIKGIIIDLKHRNVITPPKYQIEVSIMNKIVDIPGSSSIPNILLNLQSGNVITLQDFSVYEYNQGIDMKIFKINDIVYWSTSDTINSEKYLSIYYECGGKDISELISDYYDIKLVHSSVLTIDKVDLGDRNGYIIDNIGNMERETNNIIVLSPISIDDANKILNKGDGKLGDGGSVIIQNIYMDDITIYHIKSKAYAYRSDFFINFNYKIPLEDSLYEVYMKALVPNHMFTRSNGRYADIVIDQEVMEQINYEDEESIKERDFYTLIEKIWIVLYSISTPSTNDIIEELYHRLYDDVQNFVLWILVLKDKVLSNTVLLPYFPENANYSENRISIKWIEKILINLTRESNYDKSYIFENIEKEIWLLRGLLKYMKEENDV